MKETSSRQWTVEFETISGASVVFPRITDNSDRILWESHDFIEAHG